MHMHKCTVLQARNNIHTKSTYHYIQIPIDNDTWDDQIQDQYNLFDMHIRHMHK